MNKSMLNFENQYVLVTGATRGIGKITAGLFIQQGARVIITGTGIECPNTLRAEWGENFDYVQANFSSKKGIQEFILQLDNFHRIDVCVNNAGINRLSMIEEVDDDDYEIMLSVNLHAPFCICRYMTSRMKKQGYGRVVNIASIWSSITKSKRTVYTISKNAILGLTKTMAVETAPFGVTVNAVSPGFTMTELTMRTLSEVEILNLSAQVPAKRFADPIEISNVILFLSSKENSYMTGQNIVVDGGFTNV